MQNSLMQNSARQFKTLVFKQVGCNLGSIEGPVKGWVFFLFLESKPPSAVSRL